MDDGSIECSFRAAIVAVISSVFYIPVCFQLVPVVNFYLSRIQAKK